jgi:predicted anti-sigma-YlaC factor YlaD
MTDNANKMSCEAFQAQLPDLIGSGEIVSAHPHLENCELCRAFLADLEAIAEAARQLFPVEEPPDKLWEKIESAIKKEEAGVEMRAAAMDVHAPVSDGADDGSVLSLDGMGLPDPDQAI